MAGVEYSDFQEWMDDNNLSEDDLWYMQKKLRLRLIVWLLISSTYFGLLTLPFLIITWIQYKRIKQRSFSPRPGLFFTLYTVAMYITFLMIVPLVFWLIVKRTNWSTGMKGLFRKGLVGDGEESVLRRQEWERIRKGSRIVRVVICVILTVVIFLLSVADYNKAGRVVTTEMAVQIVLSVFVFFDILGLLICGIVNNIRYRAALG